MANEQSKMIEPYIDADGWARFCQACGAPLTPNILDDYWIHEGSADCQAVTKDHGMQRYNQPTADTHYIGQRD